MASTSEALRVFGPKTGMVPGPTRIASATSTALDAVTGGANASGGPPGGVSARWAADSVPPMPVDEWQAAQLDRYNSGPSDQGALGPAGSAPGGRGGVSGATNATID